MKLENKIFDGKEYTLVDIYNWKTGDDIYHFAGDESELFCAKIENMYIPIKNQNFIEEIKEYYNLYRPEIYFMEKSLRLKISEILYGMKNIEKVSLDLRKKIIDEQIEKLSELGDSIDKIKLEERLKDTDIYNADNWNLQGTAFYSPVFNLICFTKQDTLRQDISTKRTRLHETIHALTGPKALLTKYDNKTGLMEGATENIVEKLYGNKTSSRNGMNEFNFSKQTDYKYQVCLIRQMEYALNNESTESILNGNIEFFKQFEEKYGKDTFRFINHRANRLLHPEKIKDEISYFRETQNTILEAVFNKDFSQIESIEDAKTYFKRLQDFELVQAKIKGDKTFEKFYKDKLQQAKQKIIEKGLDSSYVEDTLKEFEYQEKDFYPIETEQEKYSRLQSFVIEEISNKIQESPNIKEDISKFKTFFKEKDKKEYLLIAKDEEFVSLIVGDAVNSTIYRDAKVNQDEKGISISLSENENILLNEIPLSQNSELFQTKIEEVVNRKQLYEKQKSEMQKIAQTQRLSRVNRIITKIKEHFQNKQMNKEVGDKGNDNER